jgi:hypothetical protein
MGLTFDNRRLIAAFFLGGIPLVAAVLLFLLRDWPPVHEFVDWLGTPGVLALVGTLPFYWAILSWALLGRAGETPRPAESVLGQGSQAQKDHVVDQADDTQIKYDYFHDMVRYHPESNEYEFFAHRTIRNIGRRSITQDYHYIWCNRFPNDSKKSERFYRKNPLRWDKLRFEAWDADGRLETAVINSLGARIDHYIIFGDEHVPRPLEPGATRDYYYRYYIPVQLFGPYLERLVHFPIDLYRIEARFPSGTTPRCWAYVRRQVRDREATETAVERSVDNTTAEIVFRWTSDQIVTGYSYGLGWNLADIDDKE